MIYLPHYAGTLANLYYRLRARRAYDLALRRRLYRYIFAEKKRLFLEGVDEEEIRLLCRYLANPANKHAEIAFLRHHAQLRLPIGKDA